MGRGKAPPTTESARGGSQRYSRGGMQGVRRVEEGGGIGWGRVVWMGAQWLGGQIGLETRFVFLFDLAAIAGFVWAMVVTYQIWRGRRG